MKKKILKSILIADDDISLLPPVINCLAASKQFKIYLMSSTRNNPMRFSRHINHFTYYQKVECADAWIKIINKEIEKYGIDLVMPVSENYIRKLLKYRHKLREPKKLMLLPTLNSFDIANDKGLLSNHLNFHNLPHPKGELISSLEDLNKIDNLSFPVISKPTVGYSGGKHIRIFKNKNTIETHFKTNGFICEYIVQEYIVGYDIDCSVLCKDGKILAHTIQRGDNSIKNNSKVVPAYGHFFLNEAKLYSIVEKLMKTLNWSGVAHIDMRYDEKEKQFKVIEINPRFWLSIEGSLHAGVNFPKLCYAVSKKETFFKPTYKQCRYISLKGLKLMVKQKKEVLFKWKFIYQNTNFKYTLKDPIPFVYRFFALRLGILIIE